MNIPNKLRTLLSVLSHKVETFGRSLNLNATFPRSGLHFADSYFEQIMLSFGSTSLFIEMMQNDELLSNRNSKVDPLL